MQLQFTTTCDGNGKRGARRRAGNSPELQPGGGAELLKNFKQWEAMRSYFRKVLAAVWLRDGKDVAQRLWLCCRKGVRLRALRGPMRDRWGEGRAASGPDVRPPGRQLRGWTRDPQVEGCRAGHETTGEKAARLG